MRQRRLVGFLQVFQQRPGGSDGGRLAMAAKSAQIVGAELGAEQPLGTVGHEMPGRAFARGGQAGPEAAFHNQGFHRVQARVLGHQLTLGGAVDDDEPPGGHIGPGQAKAAVNRRNGGQTGGDAGIEQGVIGGGAGRDQTGDGAFHRPLFGPHLAHLLGNGHRLALTDQLGQVRVQLVIRHAGHDHRLPGRLAAPGQGDVEQPRGASGVVIEQLVEIAHAEQQQMRRMLGLERQVLLHQRGVGAEVLQGGAVVGGWGADYPGLSRGAGVARKSGRLSHRRRVGVVVLVAFWRHHARCLSVLRDRPSV